MNSIKFQDRELFPSKIVCVGRNYVEHIEELNNEMPENMVIFNKPNSAISDEFHYISSSVRFEGEVSFLILEGKIAGVGFGFDLTDAKSQNYLKSKGLPWERAKAFDKSALFSEFLPISSEDIPKISFKLYRNGNLAQFANYDLMIYKPEEILKEVESFMTLEDGDIIMSGTPKGVSSYTLNDIFELKLNLGSRTILKRDWVVV